MCTQGMSAPPPVARRHSGIRVMITPGEQPPPSGVPIYTNFAKGTLTRMKYTNILTCSHIDITSVSSHFFSNYNLDFVGCLFLPLPREWCQWRARLHICTERSGMYMHKYSLDNLLYDQSLQEIKILMLVDLSKTKISHKVHVKLPTAHIRNHNIHEHQYDT